jgi:hypothetical protein
MTQKRGSALLGWFNIGVAQCWLLSLQQDIEK